MANEELIRDLAEIIGVKEYKNKNDLCEFAELLKYSETDYGIMGFLTLLQDHVYLRKISDIIGNDLECRLVAELDDKEILEDEEELLVKERSDLLIRFAHSLQKYDYDLWSPIIKARFEKGLDDLEKLLKQGDFCDKQKELIKASS